MVYIFPIKYCERGVFKINTKTEVRDERKKWGTGGESLASWVLDKFLPPSSFSVAPLHCSTPCRTWDGVNSSTSTLLSQKRNWNQESSPTKCLCTAHASALSSQIVFVIFFSILTIFGAAVSVQQCNQVLPFIVKMISVEEQRKVKKGRSIKKCTGSSTAHRLVAECSWIVTAGQLQRPQELLSQEAVVVYLIQLQTLDDCIWGLHRKMMTHHYFPGALLRFTGYFQTNIQSSYLWYPSIFLGYTISIWINIVRKKET